MEGTRGALGRTEEPWGSNDGVFDWDSLGGREGPALGWMGAGSVCVSMVCILSLRHPKVPEKSWDTMTVGGVSDTLAEPAELAH